MRQYELTRQSLANRSIASAGVEFRCNIDFFFERRAIEALKRLKAQLLKQNPPPLPPAFCQVDPPAIDPEGVASQVVGGDLDWLRSR